MTEDFEGVVKDALFSVAPDLEGEKIDPDKTFRDQFEIDSIDFLNFVIRLSKASGIDIPEEDYPELESLQDAVAYLCRRKGSK